jgi:hypothetical protein
MANNYTVSSLETPTGIIETPGDNVSNSTPTYILTITPDPGYSITHSNFVANSLPSEISSVTFAQNGDIVVATVNFATNFVMPSSDVDLQIDIDGSAQLKNYTVAGTYSTTETNTTTSSVSNVAYNNNGNYTTTELLFSKTFTVSSASGSGFSGYYFETEPYISFSSMHLFGPRASRYNITTSKVYNSENQLTSKTFNVNYTYPPLDHSADSISFIANAVKIYNEPLEIKSYKIVTKNLSKFGESRSLRIYGSPGSKFDLTITKNSGDTYNFADNVFTSTSSYDDDRTIPSLGYYDYDILFPGGTAADGSITQDNTYTIFIEAGTNTALQLQSPLLDKFDIKQLLDKSVTISVSDSGSTGYTISSFAPITGPVGEADPVVEFNNIFTISYSSAITIVGQPLVTNFVSAADVGNTDVGFSDVTLTQGATNTVNLTIPKSYIYEFGESNVVFNLDIASFISVATNTQPVASPQIRSAVSSIGKSLTLVGSDAENSPLTFAIASNPSNGTLSNLNTSNGFVVYTSNSGFTGSDSFTFTVNDGDLTSTAATVTLNVAAQSLAPTATDIFSWREGNSGSYTTLLSWEGDVSYTNLTTGSSNIGLSVTNWSLDSIHTGYPNYIDGYEDFDVDYEFKDSNGTVLYSSYLQVNTSTSMVDSYGATLNFSNTSILIPGTYNSGNGLISGASYTLEIKLSYNNNSQP